MLGFRCEVFNLFRVLCDNQAVPLIVDSGSLNSVRFNFAVDLFHTIQQRKLRPSGYLVH